MNSNVHVQSFMNVSTTYTPAIGSIVGSYGKTSGWRSGIITATKHMSTIGVQDLSGNNIKIETVIASFPSSYGDSGGSVFSIPNGAPNAIAGTKVSLLGSGTAYVRADYINEQLGLKLTP